ncbi:extracellular solute-binding protein [Ornithinibacillus sp. BX22]|uniref:Extracellular solute-binding protein n=2 Tax=Ornithinibacillus TaxID=484508 RepID=A0A923L8F1_9BACI|nr:MULTISPECIES: ABC transporter substrate-binding protein [Ornithinibacillus]MBC5638275.1 extracellular solute-binding protein [Ornithinibacillus hominis]MBS3680945.1 extracellular solute-binding protein [Ornithinibacillus massiliensis]
MKKLKLALVAGIFTTAILLGACGANDDESTGAEKSNPSTDNNTITVYSAGPGGLAENIQEAFEEETGIKVEMFQSTTGKILSRLEAEANNPVADVVVLASVPSMEGLKSEGKLQAYEAENGDSINPDWSDPEHYYYGYSAAALGVAYNTNQVDSIDADWSDFSKPEWQGRVTMPDPTSSGSAVDFLYGLTNANDDGWDTIQSWMDNDLLIAGANKESLNAVITGDKDVVVSAVDYMTYKAKNDGEPVDIYYPKSGTVISPRAAGILTDAQNVEGAKAFMDFLLSDKAQEMVANAYILPGNNAIKLNDRPALNEIPTLPVDWENAEEKQVETLNKFSSMN